MDGDMVWLRVFNVHQWRVKVKFQEKKEQFILPQ